VLGSLFFVAIFNEWNHYKVGRAKYKEQNAKRKAQGLRQVEDASVKVSEI
jgi:hypothetical protein